MRFHFHVLHTATALFLLAQIGVLPWHSSDLACGEEPVWNCVQTEEHLTIRRGDSEVLRYNIVAPKAPVEKYASYERSGYIHPIYTPRGRTLTGDFAADHPHQHGLFVAWTSASHDGRKVDFWNQHKGRGIVLHDRVVSVGERDFKVAVKHYAKRKDGTKTAILDDVWSVTSRFGRRALRDRFFNRANECH